MTTCVHLTTPREPVAPDSSEGCADCPREGARSVHLRQCLDCGHVACCDSSPARHAEAHFLRSGHPVMQSFERGEQWVWCYVDEQMAQRPASSGLR